MAMAATVAMANIGLRSAVRSAPAALGPFAPPSCPGSHFEVGRAPGGGRGAMTGGIRVRPVFGTSSTSSDSLSADMLD